VKLCHWVDMVTSHYRLAEVLAYIYRNCAQLTALPSVSSVIDVEWEYFA
jgi:hypothetical protein